MSSSDNSSDVMIPGRQVTFDGEVLPNRERPRFWYLHVLYDLTCVVCRFTDMISLYG
jgi:hypothetical protein